MNMDISPNQNGYLSLVNDISTKDSLFTSTKDDKETLLYKVLLWVDKRRKRTEYVKIDYYDTWSMDSTLSIIILPMLKQLQSTKHGSHDVDLEDVPEYMRTTDTEEYEAQATFEFYREDKEERKYNIHDRWDWIIGEMIWAFEQIVEDNEAKFFEGLSHEDFDRKGYEEYHNRINNGLKLFGKYFRGLWD